MLSITNLFLMKLNTFLSIFEKELEVKKGTFKENKALSQIPEWDSLAIMTFISFVSKKLKKNVNPESLSKCKTTSDLGKLLKLKN
tara:strand:- start:105 stop:359 length:255 start_codon:yes stop_codon:yes gene_type:complete